MYQPVPNVPKLISLCIKPSCQTLSKAFNKSRKTNLTSNDGFASNICRSRALLLMHVKVTWPKTGPVTGKKIIIILVFEKRVKYYFFKHLRRVAEGSGTGANTISLRKSCPLYLCPKK